jgi:hypothetical protein
MVETELVTDDIVDGRKALDALDAEGAGVRSALWLYVPDAAEWRLILSLPIVDREGPEAGYKLVQKALAKHSVFLPLRRISVVGTTEPIAARLRRFLKTTPPAGAANIKLRSTVLDGIVIEGAHVYRST